jgi:hypothetical protein
VTAGIGDPAGGEGVATARTNGADRGERMTRHRGVGVGLAVVLIGLGGVPAAGQGARRAAERPLPPGARLTQQILLASYPELRDQGIAWRITGQGAALVVEARAAVPPLATTDARARPGPTEPLAAGSEPPLVRALTEVDGDGVLVAVRLDGTLSRPAALLAARAAAAPIEALAAVDARFRPDDPAAADRLVSTRLTGVLAASRVAPGIFQAVPTDSAEALTWLVDVDRPTDGTVQGYALTFEPVEGRLLAVVRR